MKGIKEWTNKIKVWWRGAPYFRRFLVVVAGVLLVLMLGRFLFSG